MKLENLHTFTNKIQKEDEVEREEIITILKNTHNLPCFVDLKNIVQILDQENSSTEKIAGEIEGDIALSAKVLTIVNTPFYGLSRKVGSIPFAVMVLGFAELKNIIWSIIMFEMFKVPKEREEEAKNILKHSILTAKICRYIAKELGLINTDECYTAGILHNCGTLALIRKVDINDIQNCGMDRTEMSSILLENWSVPGLICETIFYMNNPAGAGESIRKHSSILNFSAYLAKEILNLKDAWYLKNCVMMDKVVCKELFNGSFVEFGRYENIVSLQFGVNTK